MGIWPEGGVPKFGAGLELVCAMLCPAPEGAADALHVEAAKAKVATNVAMIGFTNASSSSSLLESPPASSSAARYTQNEERAPAFAPELVPFRPLLVSLELDA